MKYIQNEKFNFLDVYKDLCECVCACVKYAEREVFPGNLIDAHLCLKAV